MIRLLELAPQASVVENVVAESLQASISGSSVNVFRRFSQLWHLSRDISGSRKTLDLCLNKMVSGFIIFFKVTVIVIYCGILKSFDQVWNRYPSFCLFKLRENLKISILIFESYFITRLPTKDETSETTVHNLFTLIF